MKPKASGFTGHEVATTIEQRAWDKDLGADAWICRYHATKVFAIAVRERDSKKGTVYIRVRLNSDGWRTVTTKRRINQSFDSFKLHCRVHQKNYEWFCDATNTEGSDVRLPFTDGMILRFTPQGHLLEIEKESL